MKHIILILMLCQLISAQDKSLSFSEEEPDPVLLITAKGGIFDLARNGLVNELRDDFSLSTIEINDTTSLDDIDRIINSFTIPKVVICIGNKAVHLYKSYDSKNRIITKSIQVVTILALDIKRAVAGIPNVNGIAYETPMVTALVGFRRVMGLPLAKVGVIYRAPFRDFLDEHSRYCAREKISIKSFEISNDPSGHKEEISTALRKLVKKEHIDALWIANDDVLLTPDLLGTVWLPILNRTKIPVIVGVEALVKPDLNFGTFAVIPDAVALGEQAADIVFDLKLDNWEHTGTIFHSAFSMYSVLNLKKAKQITKQTTIKTYEVSKVLK